MRGSGFFFLVTLALSCGACSSTGGGSGPGAGGSGNVGFGGSGAHAGSGGHAANAGSGGTSSGGTSSGGTSSGGTSSGGTGGTSVDGWSMTPQWTTLPIPLNAHPSIAADPKNPTAFSILTEPVDINGPLGLAVAQTSDLGTSFPNPVIIQSYAGAGPGVGAMPRGFAYDPKDPMVIAALADNPALGFDKGNVFAVSTDGGKTFDAKSLMGMINPFPADELNFAGGDQPELAIRAQQVIYLSNDHGQSFGTSYQFDDCLAHGTFAVRPDDHTEILMACDDAVIKRCKNNACTPSTFPGTSVMRMEYAPHDGTRVLAAGYASGGGTVNLYLSTDAGATFTLVQTGSSAAGGWRVAFDPRDGSTQAFALLGDKVFRSTDSGATWSDITPQQSLNQKDNLMVLVYDFAVRADGGLVGEGVFSYLLLDPLPL